MLLASSSSKLALYSTMMTRGLNPPCTEVARLTPYHQDRLNHEEVVGIRVNGEKIKPLPHFESLEELDDVVRPEDDLKTKVGFAGGG